MRLAAAVLAALALAPAAHAAEPVAWEDPCGDAGGYATVAGQRQALPSDDGLDLRGATVVVRDEVIEVALRTCGPIDDQPLDSLSLHATLPDGCELRVQRFARGDLRDPAAPSAGPATQVIRNCETTAPFEYDDESEELPAAATRVEGDLLAVTVPRSVLGGLLAPGTVLRDVAASGAEVGAFGPQVVVGSTVVFDQRSGTLDLARGPEELALA